MIRTVLLPDKVIKWKTSPIIENDKIIGHIRYNFWDCDIEIYDQSNNIIIYGRSRFKVFGYKWVIMNCDKQAIGELTNIIKGLDDDYRYTSVDGTTYLIKDSANELFYIQNETTDEIICKIKNVSARVSFKPYSYEVTFETAEIDTMEVVSVLQGIRSIRQLKWFKRNT